MPEFSSSICECVRFQKVNQQRHEYMLDVLQSKLDYDAYPDTVSWITSFTCFRIANFLGLLQLMNARCLRALCNSSWMLTKLKWQLLSVTKRTFALDGFVNKLNCLICETKNPMLLYHHSWIPKSHYLCNHSFQQTHCAYFRSLNGYCNTAFWYTAWIYAGTRCTGWL